MTGRNIYACVGIGEHQPAITLYRKLLAASSGAAELHVSLANSLKAVGRQKEAAECYQMAAAARPSFGDAWWSLANLKTYRFSEDEIAHMRAKETAPAMDPVDHYHLCFALGKAFEDRNEYAESWQFYERGNALKRTESLYRSDISETNTRKQIEVCTAQFFAARASAGVPDPDPIFIVGLPRSGSTLIEQIPASHSQVEGTQELFIHLMMPNAKIIDARREPMACCFSNLKQLFTRGQEFTYSIEDIARYYRTYLELMRHWDAVLPGRILRVWYEDVVEDLEGNVRRILKFCGLEFEPACVEFYKTERSISTASSEQVRQPIFRDGLFQWRNYERWLGPLKDNLDDGLIRYRE